MNINTVIESLKLRLTSGNSVPVESTRITKEEFDIILDYIEELETEEILLQLAKERYEKGDFVEVSIDDL